MTYSSSPGTYILTGSGDRNIRLYNPFPGTSSSGSSNAKDSIPEGRLIETFSGHGYEVLSIAVGAGNERFLSGGGDRSAFLWDVAKAVTTRKFGGNIHGHSSRINCVAFAGESDSVVVSGSFDRTVRLWDTKSNDVKPIQVLDEAKDSITCLAVSGPSVLSGSVDGRVRVYDMRMGKITTDTIGPSVTSLSLTNDGKAMLVGSLDSKLRLMDRDNGKCLRTYSGPSYKNEEFRTQSMLGNKDRHVIAGDEQGHMWAWDMLTGKVHAKIAVPWGPAGYEPKKKVIGKDGKEKARVNVISSVAWRDNGWGDQFCVGGTSGVATVFGAL